MTDKELKQLNRKELLEMLIDVTKDVNRLKKENEELRKQIEDRELRINNVGSIAEAALQLNGVFEAAQAAADQYLESVMHGDDLALRMQHEAEEKAATILNAARTKAREIEEQAEHRAAETAAKAEEDAAARLKAAEKQAQDYLAAVTKQLNRYTEEQNRPKTKTRIEP